MRMSRLFGETLRRPPAEAGSAGQALLARAAYLRQHAPGVFSYLPLGLRTADKIKRIIRQEIDAIGGQEVRMPLVQSASLWDRSGRLREVGDDLVQFRDRAGRKLVLGTSHEDIAVELARSEIHSHRQRPALFYHFQTVFRDEPRTSGILRAREFEMLASYSFDRDEAGLEIQFEKHRTAFRRVLRRLELDPVLAARAGVGLAEASDEELFFPTDVGDDSVATCDACGHTASRKVAAFKKPEPEREPQRPLEKVATPDADTIAALAAFLQVPTERTAKVVFFSAASRGARAADGAPRELLVMALVRGDMEVSEAKLRLAANACALRPAEAAAIRRIGAEPGFASPIGVAHEDLLVVVDDLAAATPNLVCGANEPGYHYRNVNYGRDYGADVVADIAAVPAGASCLRCGAPLRLAAGIELASLHRFGSAAQALGLAYQDADGSLRQPVLGAFGMGLGRTLGLIAEVHHDDAGLRLPASVAPFQVHLVAIGAADADILERAEALYYSLSAAGLEVLYDDRDASPGVKLNDADLIGIPLRLALGKRSLEQGGVELKRRSGPERWTVSAADLPSALTAELEQVESA
ncbi:MAG: proline--tRNA ligase [Gemmatimonadota bacterium]|nr:MAG: proline--tRNA ligase [Gemmatimonadota bacterium]